MNDLAEILREMAQALEESPPAPPETADPETDQLRCYRAPGFIVRNEREALQEHQADDLAELLEQARDELSLTVLFLSNFHDATKVGGDILQHLGESLGRPLSVLNRVCSIFADFTPQPLACSE